MDAYAGWKFGPYLMASIGEAAKTTGFIRSGLAMSMRIKASPKGRRPPTWSLTHLGSGHRVALIDAHPVEAFEVANAILALTDWTFDGLSGWRNQDPDLMDKLKALRSQYPKALSRTGGTPSDPDIARAIAMARA